MTQLDNTEDIPFFLDSNEFKRFFNNDQFSSYNRLIQFSYVLPFHIPFPSHVFISLPMKNNEHMSVCFSKYTEIKKEPHSLYRANIEDTYELHFTRIEIAYFCNENIVDTNRLSDIFDISLEKLNSFILSYRSKHHDNKVYRLTKEAIITPFLLVHLIKDKDFNNPEKLIFPINFNVDYTEEDLTIDQFLEVCSFSQRAIDTYINPFVFIEEFHHEANRQLKEGSFRDAVINSQSGIETFFHKLYFELKKELGQSNTKIRSDYKKVKGQGFYKLIKEGVGELLFINWDKHKNSSILKKWNKNTYKLRNKVVHDGYNPVLRETEEAISSANNMRKFFIEELKNKQDTYPKTNLFYAAP